MKITATAPTRIDLAGGSLDLYPLYLFEEGGITVNCAIDIFCSVSIESRKSPGIRLRSVDLGTEEEYKNLDSLSFDGPLGIVSRAIRFFRPDVGLDVTTENRVRKGSGLGASSSLLVAAMASLNELTGAGYSNGQIIDFAADLEAQCIGIPTGKQDYFAALFGGVSALWFGVGESRRECLLEADSEILEMEQRLILSFTGAQRFSGVTNWNIIKDYIERDPAANAGMKKIKRTAEGVRACILDRKWNELASLLDEEWRNRRELADGVTNEKVDALMQAALNAGALANKLCGAGGGGCMITYAEPEKRSSVEQALAAAGAEVLPFRVVRKGIVIEHLP